MITIGAVDVQCILESVRSTIALSMLPVELVGGVVRWRDNGREYDNYTTSMGIFCDGPSAAAFEEALEMPSFHWEATFPGSHLFSPLWSYTSDLVTIVADKVTSSPALDGRGQANRYAITAFKGGPALAMAMAGSQTPCNTGLSTCSLGGAWFHQPRFNVDKGNEHGGIQRHGGATSIDRDTHTGAEVTTFRAVADLEGTRALLFALAYTIRGGDATLHVPAGAYPFGRQYSATDYTVALADNTFTCEQLRGEYFAVELKLQLRGVQ